MIEFGLPESSDSAVGASQIEKHPVQGRHFLMSHRVVSNFEHSNQRDHLAMLV